MKEIGKNNFVKIIKRVLIVVVSVLFVFVIAGYFLGKAYEDKIEQIVVSEINKNLNSEVSVRNIEFSLLKDFPYATFLIYDVVAMDATTQLNKDTLLEADLISLNFNIIDLFQKNYILKRIVLNNARLNLRVYNNNTDNFHFLKTVDDTLKSPFSLSLDKVILKNVAISFKNDLSEQDYSIFAKKAVLKGKFSESNYSLDIGGNIRINNIISNKVSYLKDQNARLKLFLKVDQLKKSYKIEKGELSFDKLTFDIDGSIAYGEKENNIDLRLIGKDLDLSSFIQKLPDKYKDHVKNLKAKGRFYLVTQIIGKFGDNYLPEIKAEFNFENGNIIHKKTSVVLTDVQFSGSYTNGKTRALESSKIVINNFSAGLKEGSIKVNFKMTNFVKPEVVLVTDSELDLGELQNFVKIDTIQVISGKLDIKASYKGKLSSIDNFTHNDFINSTTSGKMIIKNMDYQLVGDKNIYKNLNADISFNNNDLIVDTLSGNISGSDFSLQGYFKNFLSFIFIPEENLIIEAELYSRNIKLDKLLVNNSSETEGEYKLDFSDRLEFYLDFNIEKLTFEKFEAKNISGKLKIKERKLNVPYLSMQSEDGITQAKGFIDGTLNNKLIISCDAFIKDVNVSKLFYEFGSFGQSGLTEKNINGTITANVVFSGTWNNFLKVDPASIYTKADLIIENGSLVDYPPLMELSEHIKDADLSNVKFSTLQNQIEIKNEQIFIPDMEINSDAIDIYASGLHKFNNEINYHLRVLWSELKSKNNKDEENEFGIVIDDGLSKTTLFFVISGTLDNPIVKYDKKGVKDKIISDFKKEKQKIKEIFGAEFNTKKEDPERIKEKEILKKQEEGKFVIEWNEDEKDSLKEKTIIKKRNRPEVYIEWDDEDNDTIKMK